MSSLEKSFFNETTPYEVATSMPIISEGIWDPEVVNFWVEKARQLHGFEESLRVRAILERGNQNSELHQRSQRHLRVVGRSAMQQLIG